MNFNERSSCDKPGATVPPQSSITIGAKAVRPARFVLFEGSDPTVDVTTTQEARLCGATDHAEITYSLTHSRVVVTSDQDFLRHHRAGIAHAGIIYAPQKTHSTGVLIRRLKLIHDVLEDGAMFGEVEHV